MSLKKVILISETDQKFPQLLTTCSQLMSGMAGGVIIGGIAVYLHTYNQALTQQIAGATHDADIYISLEDLSSLRDEEELTSNKRLRKHQLIKKGFEFDVYTQFQSGLRIPYDEVIANCVMYGEEKVASLEHLFVLKMDAFLDRQGSVKGDKDAQDILRISSVISAKKTFNIKLIAPYLDDEHLELFKKIGANPIAMGLAKGDSRYAKKLRSSFLNLESEIVKEYISIHSSKLVNERKPK